MIEKRDKTAYFQAIYVKYSGELLRFACKFISSYSAEDVVHNVFLRLWDKQAFCLPEEELKKYLYVSVRNLCVDYLRRLSLEQDALDKRRIQLKLDELDFYDDTDRAFILKDQRELLMKKVEELPLKAREIFKLAYLHDMKSSEIAEQLNLSVRTVENQLYRSLLVLRKSCSRLLILLITIGVS